MQSFNIKGKQTRSKLRFVYGVLILLYFPLLSSSLESKSLKILFGSCLHQKFPAPILKNILNENPDYFFLLGDNIYFDTEIASEKEPAYKEFFSNPDWLKISKKINVRSVWDDHDYGLNDSGGEYSEKEISRNLYLKYLGSLHPKSIQHGSPQGEGIYFSEVLVKEGKKIHFIFLDTRYFRSPLKRNFYSYFIGKKYYTPDENAELSMLGEAQWAWLQQELKIKSDLLVLVSSIQVIATEHPFEKWENFPLERTKLIRAIEESNAKETIIFSGDRHIAEIYKLPSVKKGNIVEITSSSLNLPLKTIPLEFGSEYKIGNSFKDANFGRLSISLSNPVLDWTAEILNESGETVLEIKKEK